MLDKIGFYTLSDERAKNASGTSPMMRCEIILTNRCNFKCLYCRGLYGNSNRVLAWNEIKTGLNYWIKDRLQNVRFSGGEPTLHKNLIDAIELCVAGGVKRIAVSSNGSLPITLYDKLLVAGVNDFSISLDACCASDGDIMAGVIGKWENVISNIKYLATKCYVSVGIVVTNENIKKVCQTVLFAHNLGVADIRVIPAAQFTRENNRSLSEIPDTVLDAHPILKYRINRALLGHSVRGISKTDCHKCYLVLDDSVIAGDSHFPCVIYMREKGNPIGKVGASMRQERIDWSKKHNSYNDAICKNNCLDVCIGYNNQFEKCHLLTKEQY
jgi:molybdenum cofactor biosynthesis enzyme MoaA